MTNIHLFDAETRRYFDGLPAIMQENIIQSDIVVNGKEDLVTYYENAMTNMRHSIDQQKQDF